MKLRLRHTAVGVVLVATVMPTAAQGKLQLRHAEYSSAELLADRVRYAASKPEAGSLVVRDEFRGTRRVVPVGNHCRANDAHAGIFLIDCDREPFLVTPGAATLRPVPGEGTSYDPNNETMSEVGTRWLEGVTKRNEVFYVNWHTGKRQDFGEVIQDPGRDLDSRDLRRLPRGLVARSNRRTLKFGRRGLMLERPGRSGLVVDACHYECLSITLGGGLVTWASPDTAHALVIRSGRRYQWKFDRTISSSGISFGFAIQHTRRHIYVNLPQSRGQPTTFDVLRALWRR
jgi:hypothetical protein